jgi:L-methionine (R)-S-oxide reductase
VPDVSLLPYHIACSSATRSEIVVPVVDYAKTIRAVLDVDSNELKAFDRVDQEQLEGLAAELGRVYGG